MCENRTIVTIDGPSGVGKSTISRRLASRLGYTYLDTGAMYRCVGLYCHWHGVDPDDEQAVSAIIDSIDMELLPPLSPREDIRVFLNGRDVSGEIRTPEISMFASRVSALSCVRSRLTQLQQQMGRRGKIVAEGRDTGTVVFPQAAHKFYLDADPEERARRRISQLRKSGRPVDKKEIYQQIIRRDRNDSRRTIAPMQAAPDAIHIDSTHLSAAEVVEKMETAIREKGGAGRVER